MYFLLPLFCPSSGSTCHRSFQSSILVAACLAYHSSQHVGRHYSVVSYFKRPDIQGSASAAFNALAAQRHVFAQTMVLFLSLSGSYMGDIST